VLFNIAFKVEVIKEKCMGIKSMMYKKLDYILVYIKACQYIQQPLFQKLSNI